MERHLWVINNNLTSKFQDLLVFWRNHVLQFLKLRRMQRELSVELVDDSLQRRYFSLELLFLRFVLHSYRLGEVEVEGESPLLTSKNALGSFTVFEVIIELNFI